MSHRQPVQHILPSTDEKARYVNSMFGRIAGRYDLMNALMTMGQDRKWRRFTVRASRPKQGGIALDMATGTGELALELARHGMRVVGADFCQEMVERGKEKVEHLGLERQIQVVVGDGLRLPFPDNSFDCATTGFAMRNVTDIGQAFAEMQRVVKPGGYVACLEASRPASPLAAAFHRLYFHRLVPLLGRIVSGDGVAYTYLPNSLIPFPNPPAVRRIMEEAGLTSVRYYPLAMGGVTVHVGRK